MQVNVNFLTPTSYYVNQSSQKSAVEVVSALRPDKPKVEPAWKPTPSTDSSNLVQHYLKLSKIRLTSK